MAQDIADRFKAFHRLVGNTPLLAVDVRYRGQARRVYAKYESLSLTGSVKDRMALFILEDAYRAGRIRPSVGICSKVGLAHRARRLHAQGDDLHRIALGDEAVALAMHVGEACRKRLQGRLGDRAAGHARPGNAAHHSSTSRTLR